MKVENKIRLERSKLKIRQAWNEFKDFLLILFLLNLFISIMSDGNLVLNSRPNATIDTSLQVSYTPIKEVSASEGIVEASLPYGNVGEFSAFTADINETDSDPFTMASGKKVYVGSIACPRSIKLGTKIEVENLGEFICEDRMNIRYTNNFDIYMESKSEALKFGRKELKYKIIN